MKFEKYVAKIGDKVKIVYRGSKIFGKVGEITLVPNPEEGETRWVVMYEGAEFTFRLRTSFVVVRRA